jgi:hypothetical protein
MGFGIGQAGRIPGASSILAGHFPPAWLPMAHTVGSLAAPSVRTHRGVDRPAAPSAKQAVELSCAWPGPMTYTARRGTGLPQPALMARWLQCCNRSRAWWLYRDSMRETLEAKMLRRIGRKRGDVFLRSDFADLGGYDQVGRALRRLVKAGRLLRIGYGLYSRAIQSPFDDSLIPPRGLTTLKEALNRVGIEVVPSRSMQDYNAGRTTQVPTGRVVGVYRRVRRRVGYSGISLSFEHARPEIR